MNDKLQYASMLEIPVNTCNITYKPEKKRLFKRKKTASAEEVKNELLEKINSADEVAVESTAENFVSPEPTATVKSAVPKKRFNFKITPVKIELALIGILAGVIILTNIFNANSGINAFFKGVFSTTSETPVVKDEREYTEFSPVFSFDDGEYQTVDGITTVSAKGSIYSPCDGKVKSINLDGNGKYIIEIEHSGNFKSVLSGIDYAYITVGDSVYGNIPVGFVAENDSFSMCFKGTDDSLITDYEIVDNAVVWAV